MNKFNYVYKTINLESGKSYIGSHSTNDLNDGYMGSGKLILKAFKKYGKEKFKKIILNRCNNINEAYLLEEKYINEYNTLIPIGYNISPKGGHRLPKSLSEETKSKISNSISGKNPPNYGKKTWMSGKKTF